MLLYVIAILILIYILYNYITPKYPSNFPPGPKNYPLAGGAWIISKLDSQFPVAMTKLGEKYGPVTGINLGMMRSIIVNGYDTVKEVLTRDEFQGRPEILINKLRYDGKKLGLIFAEGQLWKEQRRYTLRHLREFGFGKSEIEGIIYQEIETCVETLKKLMKENDGIVSLHDAFGPAVVNVLWVILSGKRYDHKDPKFLHLLNLLYRVFRSGSQGGNVWQDWPLLRFIPPFSKQFKEMMSGNNALNEMLNKEIHWHEETRDTSYNRDFIDLYLKEIQELSDKGEAGSNYTKQQLQGICSDLFSAGAESTSNTIAFNMLYMLLYPQVQKKVQQELDSVVGKRPCSYQDRPNLPYTEAVLCELLRVAGIAPLTVPHSTTENTKLCGFDIPKNTFVMVSIHSVHQDKEYWKDPEIFRPERFLDQEGKLVKTDHLMGFGYGKRQCLGELLARMNTFDFFTSMLQTFNVEAVEGISKPSTVPVQGFTVAPKPFVAKLILR